MLSAEKMCTSCFCARKIRACFFFCLSAEFCSAVFGSRCGVARKDKAEKKLEKICSDGEKSGILYI